MPENFLSSSHFQLYRCPTRQKDNKTTKQQIYKYSFVQSIVNLISGGYCGGVPPLPIPNREVKPTCADGTAMQYGRKKKKHNKNKKYIKRLESLRFEVTFFSYVPQENKISMFDDVV